MFDLTNEPFQVTTPTAEVSWDFDAVPPLAPQYVTVEDQLIVKTICNGENNPILINLRILRPDGKVIPLQFAVKNTAGRTQAVQTFPLLEGFILSAAAVCSGTTSPTAYGFIEVGISRPPNTQFAQYSTLIAGYFKGGSVLSYPKMIPALPTDGPGLSFSQNLGNPGAGTDFVYTVPAGARQRIVGLSATLTTAVAAANRLPSLIIDDGVHTTIILPSNGTQAASLAYVYTWADSVQWLPLYDTKITAPLPSNLILQQGYRMRSATTGIQGADQWSGIWLQVTEWLDPQ